MMAPASLRFVNLLRPLSGSPTELPVGPPRIRTCGIPASGSSGSASLRAVPVGDARRWESKSLQEPIHRFPVQKASLRAAGEPLTPDGHRLVQKPGERLVVRCHTEILVVPLQLSRERAVLLLDIAVAVNAAPLADAA